MKRIYVIRNTANGLSYVGQTSRTLKARWQSHASQPRKDMPITVAIKDYGKDLFTISLLEEVPDEHADVRESFWITKLNTLYPAGYNIKLGVIWTDSSKLRASMAQSGKPKSAEHCRKLSEIAKRRRHSEKHKQALRFFTQEQAEQVRNLHASGISQNALAKRFGTSRATIQRVLNKRAGYP